MTGNPVNWFEIYVQDMARARAFYESVFGMTMQLLNNPPVEMWSFPGDQTSYGAPGSLVCAPGVGSGGNSTLVYFRCEDCAVEEARIAGAGGQVARTKMSIGAYGFVTIATDTEGNMFGLHSLK